MSLTRLHTSRPRIDRYGYEYRTVVFKTNEGYLLRIDEYTGFKFGEHRMPEGKKPAWLIDPPAPAGWDEQG